MEEIRQIPLLPRREKFSHKGDYGKVLVIAGSQGMMGAACLAAEACLRAGAGLVTLGVPESLLPVAAIKLTCVMTRPFPETGEHSFGGNAADAILQAAESMDIVALGPGLSQHPDTVGMVCSLVPRLNKPLVIDADGINALAGHTEILRERRADTVLTPHPGEFARLLGEKIGRLEEARLDITSGFAREHRCVVALKFAPTLVVDGDRYYLNTTGNPGMATGGSGDVLTGVIAGLLAQKLTPFAAAQLGVYIHGWAGDIACRKKGEVGMIASDILECLPDAFLTM